MEQFSVLAGEDPSGLHPGALPLLAVLVLLGALPLECLDGVGVEVDGARSCAGLGIVLACRWVAVRHADDHIHIAATLVRHDGRRPERGYDQRAVQREARSIEVDYGLRRLKPGDGTGAKRLTSNEHFKAKRLSQGAAARDVLRLRVHRAVAAAFGEAEFFALLESTGVAVRFKRGPSGDALGYNFALPYDTNDKGEPVFYAGSTLAPDLSLPKIRKSLTTSPEPVIVRPGNPWHQATAAAERIPHHLNHGDDQTAQGQLVLLGATLDLLQINAPTAAKAELERAAVAFERATRSRIAADLASTHALRRGIQTIWRDRPSDGDGSGIAMLLDTVLTAVALAMHWHRTHQHAQQEAAAEQALVHLQVAYAHPAQPLQALAVRGVGGLHRVQVRHDSSRDTEAVARPSVSWWPTWPPAITVVRCRNRTQSLDSTPAATIRRTRVDRRARSAQAALFLGSDRVAESRRLCLGLLAVMFSRCKEQQVTASRYDTGPEKP